MWSCIRSCIGRQPWGWWVVCAVISAIIAGVIAATGGLVFLGMAVIYSAIVAAAAVFGVVLSGPVILCILNCFVEPKQ